MVESKKNKMPLKAHQAILGKKNTRALNYQSSCLMQKAGCTSKAIKSHTIQQSSLLKISNENKEVLTLSSLKKTSFGLEPSHVSTSDATTYFGFCNSHDTGLFRCVEREIVVPTKEQLGVFQDS